MKRALTFVLLFAAACRYGSSHQKEVDAWKVHRAERLKAADGWLTLAGLYWLSDGNNDVSLPSKPPVSAQFVLQSGKVTLQPNPSLTIEGKPVIAAVALNNDTEAKPTVVRTGTLSFVAIRREDAAHGPRFGIRVRDTDAEARKHFLGLKWGYFELTIDGQARRLQVYKSIPKPGEHDESLFVPFRDATSGKETYGAARYLYAHPADASGKTIVDFNKAYNPPCAFTPYATCPLPPPQNRLPIRIEAGEKKYKGGHA